MVLLWTIVPNKVLSLSLSLSQGSFTEGLPRSSQVSVYRVVVKAALLRACRCQLSSATYALDEYIFIISKIMKYYSYLYNY